VRAFEGSAVIRDGLGKPFVESCVKLKLREWRSYAAHITQWERDHTLDC
jgi:glutamine synthetase